LIGISLQVGKARRGNGKITTVLVHSTDMYDFRAGTSDQGLGCWKLGWMSSFDIHPGTECVRNSTYREYRRTKERGSDYLIMTGRAAVAFSPPIVKVIDYNYTS
jgi:hypothetical protein